jgi:uncharacterized protein HemX
MQNENPVASVAPEADNKLDEKLLNAGDVARTDASQKPPIFRRFFCFGIVVLLVFVLVAGLVAGAIFYQRYLKQQEDVILQLTELKTNIEQQQNRIWQQNQLIYGMWNKVVQIENQGKVASEIAPLAVSYELTKAANLLLLTENDDKTAVELLKRAQQNLSDVPDVLVVKEALARASAALQQMREVDRDELLLRLDVLSQRIGDLKQWPLQNLTHGDNSTKETLAKNQNGNKNVWQRFLMFLKGALKNVLIIEKHDRVAAPVPTLEQAAVAVSGMQLKLLLAEWAVINGQDKIYKNSLQIAEEWLKSTFSANIYADKINSIAAELADLQKINVQIKKANVNSAVEMLHAAILERGKLRFR